MVFKRVINFCISISIALAILVVSMSVRGQSQLNFEAAANYSAAHDGVSFLAMQNGEIIFEFYSNGGGSDVAWMTASGTKSFWGVLLAAMVQDNIATMDERVADTILEWQSDARKSRITVSQLLSMTDGLAGQDSGPGPVETYAEAVATTAIYEPGEVFIYRPTPWQVFGEWVRRKMATEYSDSVSYIQDRIFDHLGIAPESWPLEADGYPRMPSSSVWTARQWAIFGEFVRLGGNWHGEQLVDQNALEANFVGSHANPAYGIGWWLTAETDETLTEEIDSDFQEFLNFFATDPSLPQMVIARGGGNQRIYIIPQWDMLILRQQRVDGENGRNFTDRDLWSELLNQ